MAAAAAAVTGKAQTQTLTLTAPPMEATVLYETTQTTIRFLPYNQISNDDRYDSDDVTSPYWKYHVEIRYSDTSQATSTGFSPLFSLFHVGPLKAVQVTAS